MDVDVESCSEGICPSIFTKRRHWNAINDLGFHLNNAKNCNCRGSKQSAAVVEIYIKMKKVQKFQDDPKFKKSTN